MEALQHHLQWTAACGQVEADEAEAVQCQKLHPTVAAALGRGDLTLHGWVEYGYSSTNFAASQAGLRTEAPTIEVFRADPDATTAERLPDLYILSIEVAAYPAALRLEYALSNTFFSTLDSI